MSENAPQLRAWSSLSDDEQTQLLKDYQPVLDCMDGTCNFATKLERMQRWLAERGISITEEKIRGGRH